MKKSACPKPVGPDCSLRKKNLIDLRRFCETTFSPHIKNRGI